MKLKGFTFIELLFSLCLLALLACLGLASSAFFIHKNEQQSLIAEIKAIVKYAKIQALASNGLMYLVPKDPHLNWSEGIQLIHLEKGQEPKVLYQWQWHYPHWQLIWKGVNSEHRIFLSPSPLHAINNGQFILKNTQTTEQIRIIVNRIGRVRVVNT